MKKTKGLTFTVVCLAQSGNFGEGIGNVSVLKKFTRNDSNQYTYMSRQSVRYSLIDLLGWGNTPTEAQGSKEKQVIQYAPDATIADYPEIDLFGYMKTTSKTEEAKGQSKTRRAVIRLSDAISLEPFTGDYDFLTNAGLASRVTNGVGANSLVQSEQHLSYYTYTVTVDLSLIGVDLNDGIEISNKEKAERMIEFLHTVEFLNRDIRGRDENLNPLFIVGGVYNRKNPFFKDRVRVKGNCLQVEAVKEIIESYDWLTEQTHVGLVSNMFDNEEEVRAALKVGKVSDFFKHLEKEVRDYYGE